MSHSSYGTYSGTSDGALITNRVIYLVHFRIWSDLLEEKCRGERARTASSITNFCPFTDMYVYKSIIVNNATSFKNVNQAMIPLDCETQHDHVCQ